MRRLPHISALLLGLLLSGCAYKKAMEQAALLEAAGDAGAALPHYRLALEERPGDPVASERIDAILEARCDEAISRATAAVERTDYEAAMEALAEAAELDDDRPDAYVLVERSKSELRQAFEGLFGAARFEDAYTQLDRYRDLFRRPTWLNRGYVEVRGHFRELAQHHFLEGRYAQALGALDVITTHEPDQADALRPQRHAYVTAWAEEHARIASTELRRGNPGGAAASWLKAWEVAGRPSDRQAADQMLARLRREGALSFRVDPGSGKARDRALASLVEERLLGMPNTRVQHRSPHLVVRMLPSPSQCAEEVVRTPKTSTYIAGRVDVPNPDWVALDQRVRAQEHLLVGAQRKSDTLWAVLDELSARLTTDQAELVGLLTQKPALETSVEEARTQRDRAAEVQAESLSAWEAALLERTAQLEEVAERIAAIQAKTAPLEEESRAAEAELKNVLAESRTAEEERDRLIAQRDALPATVERDVDDTLHWDLEAWTRTCEAELTVRLETSWPSSIASQKLERRAETTEDQAHIGSEAAALEEDPKAYPKSDVDLLGLVDAQNVDALVPWLEEVVAEHFHVRTTATAVGMANEPHRTTSEALRLLLGAPDRIQPEAIGLFDVQIRRAWDLSGSFAPQAAAPPTEPTTPE